MGLTVDLGDVDRREPWFTLHPALASAVAAVLFCGITVLQLAVHGTADSTCLLYVLPVSLVAIAFGFRAGLAAGLFAVLLTAVWAMVSGATLSPLGWVSRVLPLLLLGGLVGAASDRITEARRAERYALRVALTQRDAAEVNDSVVQGLAAAKWLLESGQIERAMSVIDDTAAAAQGFVSRVLGSDSVLPDPVRRPHLVVQPEHLPQRAE